ncbi:MAG: hypothetical protein LBQ28_02680 [Prevotellaceae bacterium]|nr:hypothetical protein [Prevotellaceae bacterium]
MIKYFYTPAFFPAAGILFRQSTSLFSCGILSVFQGTTCIPHDMQRHVFVRRLRFAPPTVNEIPLCGGVSAGRGGFLK